MHTLHYFVQNKIFVILHENINFLKKSIDLPFTIIKPNERSDNKKRWSYCTQQ